MKICPLVYFSVHKASSIQHSTCTRTALFPWRIKSCAQRCCTRGFLHIHPSIPAVFQRTGSGLASRTLPDAFLRCRRDPGPAPLRSREVAAAPRRWHRASSPAWKGAPDGKVTLGICRASPARSSREPWGFPFSSLFLPSPRSPAIIISVFFSLWALTRCSEGAEQRHCPRCLRFPPTQADVSPSLQDLMHCCLPSTLLIATPFCCPFFPSAGEISEPKPGSHL